jgi:hypothetical protein
MKGLRQLGNIPNHIRKALDETYNGIRKKSSIRKKKSIVQRSVSVAVALIAIGIIATNEDVQASITQFFFSNDRGAQLAIDEGFVNKDREIISDESIDIMIDQHFYDGRKLGMGLSIFFDESIQLQDVVDVTVDYRLVNGDGTYLLEMIPDTKPLKGDGQFYFTGVQEQSNLNSTDGSVRMELLWNAIGEEELHSINDSVLKIETVKLWYDDRTFSSVDGQWNLPLSNMDQEYTGAPVQYKATDKENSINIIKATAHPTSLFVQFEIDGDLSKESLQVNILNEYDETYEIGGYRVKVIDDQTTVISGNFPISVFEDLEEITLQVVGVGEVILKKQE